ncbi:NFACT RNA binding domain-containing protein [Spirochaeta cellobiosiphila]|uniref:NFACT RNA binding domain-containing protein n=1 Tax=Spirochaeta cellobiosiphila TaxID=504483 RepID=UPI0004289957|nr:NFACT family protein [Spirochaeta cellobiosiphila]
MNWVEINQVLEELDLEGSFLQKVKQPDLSHLVLEVYKPGKAQKLLIAFTPGQIRFHRTSGNYPSQIKNQRFLQFLRSRVGGGRIVKASQWFTDRIICLVITKGEWQTTLYIRLWANAANVIAVDENNRILDSYYRRPGKGENSGEIFTLPPPKDPGKKSFTLKDLPGEGDYNDKLDQFYQQKNEELTQNKLIDQARKALKTRIMVLENRIQKNSERLRDYQNHEMYKTYGDIIMANLYKLKAGDPFLVAPSYEDPEVNITIHLDPSRSPQENGENYYKKYRKGRQGLLLLQEELDNCHNQIHHYEEVLNHLEKQEDLSGLLKELSSFQRKTHKEDNQTPGLSFSSHGYHILVGRTAKENDQLLRKWVKGNDLWMHTRDYPGGYVFIKNQKGKTIPLEVLLDGGNLALLYSKAKASGQADLYYTQVKYLRRAKNAKLGTVLPTQEKNLHIKKDQSRLDRLNQGTK